MSVAVNGIAHIQLTVNDAERCLPFHASAKKIPCVDAAGRAALPEQANGTKLERFVFDALPHAARTAIVEVRRTADDGQLTVVVAMTAAAVPYVGFFNHGLMLYETNKPLLGALSVKIQDARLGHTISRDDVRRDEYFDRALDVAQELVRHELPQTAETALREAAERADLERHGLLARTIVSAKLGLSRHAWHLPLVHPIGGKTTTVVGNLVDGAWACPGDEQVTDQPPLGRLVEVADHRSGHHPVDRPFVQHPQRRRASGQLTPGRPGRGVGGRAQVEHRPVAGRRLDRRCQHPSPVRRQRPRTGQRHPDRAPVRRRSAPLCKA